MASKAVNGKIKVPVSPNTGPEPNPQQDARLVKYVRTNIQPIVASVLAQAARSGTERDWLGMREYQGIASQLSQLGGLSATVAAAAANAHPNPSANPESMSATA
jgi:hypothetical protein